MAVATDEQARKRSFVMCRLRVLLQGLEPCFFRDADYYVEGAEEYVRIMYFAKPDNVVRVTGDSLKALVMDVLRHL